jgi:hypothetical protein
MTSKELMTGEVVGLTVTVAKRDEVPMELLALRTYVVVAVGDTVVLLVPVTVPPGVMLRLVASDTLQLRVDG